MSKHDLHAIVSMSGALMENLPGDRPHILNIAYHDAKEQRDEMLRELNLEPEARADVVLLVVPEGRGNEVASGLVNMGLAHGDFKVESSQAEEPE